MLIITTISLLIPQAFAQGISIPNTLSYPRQAPAQTVQSFQGVYGSNFNETITFCNFKVKTWELNEWDIIPVIAQSADSGQSQYNDKGALLYGGTYIAENGSVIWKGLGFSANGPYDAAFALEKSGARVGLCLCTSQVRWYLLMALRLMDSSRSWHDRMRAQQRVKLVPGFSIIRASRRRKPVILSTEHTSGGSQIPS